MASSLSPQESAHPRATAWGRIRNAVTDLMSREHKRASTTSLQSIPFLLCAIVCGMTLFGFIMVLSASSVEMITQGFSPFSQAIRQIMFGLVGIGLMLVVSRIPVSVFRNRTVLSIALGIMWLLQIAVMVVGKEVNGNRNWLQFAGIQIQPSEIAKLVTVLWVALMLKRQGDIAADSLRAFVPVALAIGPLLAFILAGDDVGTVLVYAVFLFVMIWASGLSRRVTITTTIVGLLIAGAAMMSSSNRRSRVLAIFGNCQGSICDQSNSGLAALASGGFWGVGLGQSRQKYNYLPEAHNDYIFAVIGEELGLLGTMLVIFFYLGLIYCAVRIIARSADRFIQLATTGILTWLIFQALVNTMMVAGLAPVIGVPLPFISYGGSSLISALLAAGVMMAFARQTPLKSITTGDHVLYTQVSEQETKETKTRKRLGRIVAEENNKDSATGWKPVFEPRIYFKNWWQALMGSAAQKGQGNLPGQGNLTSQGPRRPSERPLPARIKQSSPVPGARRDPHQQQKQTIAKQQNQAPKKANPRPVQPQQRILDEHQRLQSKPSVPKAATQAEEPTVVSQRPEETKSAPRIPAGLSPVKKIRAREKNRPR